MKKLIILSGFLFCLVFISTLQAQTPTDIKSNILYWYSQKTNSFVIIETNGNKHAYSLSEKSWSSNKLEGGIFGTTLGGYYPVGTKTQDYLMDNLCGNVVKLEGNYMNAMSFVFGSKNYMSSSIFTNNGDVYFYGEPRTKKTEVMRFSSKEEDWLEENITNSEVPLLSYARFVDAGKYTYVYGGGTTMNNQFSYFKFDGSSKTFTKCIDIQEKGCKAYDGGITRIKSKFYILNLEDEQLHAITNTFPKRIYDFIVNADQTKVMIITVEKGLYNFIIEDLKIDQKPLADNQQISTVKVASNNFYLIIGGGVAGVLLIGIFLVLRSKRKKKQAN